MGEAFFAVWYNLILRWIINRTTEEDYEMQLQITVLKFEFEHCL